MPVGGVERQQAATAPAGGLACSDAIVFSCRSTLCVRISMRSQWYAQSATVMSVMLRSNGARPYSNGAISNGAAAATAEVVTEAAAEVVADAVPLTPMLVGPPGPDRIEIEMDSMMDPCESGNLETCAADRITSSLEEESELSASVQLNGAASGDAAERAAAAAARPPVSTAGTPYASPGGRWQNFQKYSTFQARCLEA